MIPSNIDSKRVFVGNLAWSISWQDLKDHMRSAGNVEFANVITDNNGRSKGFGIVEYSTSNEARNAIETLHDTNLHGRLIIVRQDKEDYKTESFSQVRRYFHLLFIIFFFV